VLDCIVLETRQYNQAHDPNQVLGSKGVNPVMCLNYQRNTMKILCALLASCLCGCATPLMLTGFSVGSVAVSEATGKSVTDHAVSAVNNKDCKVIRALQNQEMCQTPTATQKLQVVNTGVVPSTIQEIEAKYR
jgi:hypothetical protein